MTRGGETPADHLAPNGTAHSEVAQGLGYDPVEARRLLAEAGFSGGKGFPAFEYLIDNSGDANLNIAIQLQKMWEEQLGVHTQIRQMEKQSYLAALNGLSYDTARSMWGGDYNDPNTFLDLFSQRQRKTNRTAAGKIRGMTALMREAGSKADGFETAGRFAEGGGNDSSAR